jgi:PAS domain S-box-containing protein
MQVRANGISLAVMSYLQNHDSDSLGRIESEGKEESRLLEELQQDASRQDNTDLWAPFIKAHEGMRQATLDLLAADHEQTNSRQTLNTTGESLMAIMVSRVEPSIKSSQLNSSARLQSILAAAAEARSVTRNPDDLNAVLASQKRFHRAIEKYANLSGTRRASRWAEEAVSLFDQCVSQAQDLQRLEERKQATLTAYMQKKNVFDVVLQESHTFRGQGFSVKQVFSPEIASVAAGAFLLVIGMALALRPGREHPLSPLPRLGNILSCVEAAASGDVSRVPEVGPPDEVGGLSRAVGRLIAVLARSENLVYHLAALVESSGDAIISHTLDGSVLSWNKGAQRLYGYSAEEMKGQSITLLAPDAAAGEVERYLQRLRDGERVLPFEIVHRARSGRPVRAFVRVSAIFDSRRRIIGASFSAQELTGIPAGTRTAIRENGLI